MTYIQYVNQNPDKHIVLNWGGDNVIFPKKGNKVGLKLQRRTEFPEGRDNATSLFEVVEDKELPVPNSVVNIPIEMEKELTSGTMRRAGSEWLKALQVLYTKTTEEVEAKAAEAVQLTATLESLKQQLAAAKAELDKTQKVK